MRERAVLNCCLNMDQKHFHYFFPTRIKIELFIISYSNKRCLSKPMFLEAKFILTVTLLSFSIFKINSFLLAEQAD